MAEQFVRFVHATSGEALTQGTEFMVSNPPRGGLKLAGFPYSPTRLLSDYPGVTPGMYAVIMQGEVIGSPDPAELEEEEAPYLYKATAFERVILISPTGGYVGTHRTVPPATSPNGNTTVIKSRPAAPPTDSLLSTTHQKPQLSMKTPPSAPVLRSHCQVCDENEPVRFSCPVDNRNLVVMSCGTCGYVLNLVAVPWT